MPRRRTAPQDPPPARPKAAHAWFPPHMHQAQKRLLAEIRNADLVIEVRDARLPLGSGNPALEALGERKPRLVLFNKASLADPVATKAWRRHFERLNQPHLFADIERRGATGHLLKQIDPLLAPMRESFRRRGIRPPDARVIVSGIPNVGKSTLVNRLLRRRRVATGPEPGVTRRSTWVPLRGQLALLDTPGILLPRIETEAEAHRLAWIGALPGHHLDESDLAAALLAVLSQATPTPLREHYRLPNADPGTDGPTLLTAVAEARRLRTRGDQPDLARAAVLVLNDFRAGRLGRVTFELPPAE